ncbi:MAG: thiamine biosynthesis protein ApbE [Bacilli bacterium]|nr:thiamine biosynthesis protein ApbE [Bacilli bacterium]
MTSSFIGLLIVECCQVLQGFYRGTRSHLVLLKPLVIDLGAVAKGFAIDLAAHELKEFDGFLVNVGGDLYAGGTDESGKPWRIGIQHPEQKEQIIETIGN